MTVLQSPDLLNYCQIDRETLNSIFSQENGPAYKSLQEELNSSGQNLFAIFKLILKGDEVAANFLIYNLLSKVH